MVNDFQFNLDAPDIPNYQRVREHIDCDLLALRDLILSCDSAKGEQLPLFEVNF